MTPPIRYATSSDGVRIAFWTLGTGFPLIQLPTPTVSHIEMEWQSSDYRKWFETLAEQLTLVRYDGRGLGLSDRDCDDLSIEMCLNDLDAVASALGLKSFGIFAATLAAPVAIEYAARHQNVPYLVLWHPVPRGIDYFGSRERLALMKLARDDWDMYSLTLASANRSWEPSTNTPIEASRLESSGQKFFFRVVEASSRFDASKSLEQVKARTLVLHHTDYTSIDIVNSRFITEHIPNARLETIEGTSGLYVGDAAVLTTVRHFLEDSTSEVSEPATMQNEKIAATRAVTSREDEVLRMVAAGQTNSEISLKLGISVHTVERHLANVYEKWDIHNRVELVLEFLRRSQERA